MTIHSFNPIKSWPNITIFMVLSLVLGVPYVLKSVNPLWEPYPSIILPSGANKIATRNGTFSFLQNDIYGLDTASMEWKKLDSRVFLSPIPHRYMTALMQFDFGLPRFQDESSKNWRNRETKAWLASKLQRLGVYPGEFRVVLTKITFGLSTHKRLAEEFISEKSYRLD